MASPPPRTASSGALQKISDQIKCPVCFEDFCEPKSLPCLHVFCLRCLQALPAVGERKMLECPMCRKVTEVPQDGLKGFQTAFHITSLIEIRNAMENADSSKVPCTLCTNTADAVGYCHDCGKFICEFCSDVHKKWPQYSNHKVTAMNFEVLAQHEDEFCTDHPAHKLSLYCESCSQLLCSMCAKDPSHEAHKLQPLTEVIHQCKDAIAQYLDPVRVKLGYVNGAIDKVDAKSTHVSEQAEDLWAHINSDITKMQAALEQRKKELKNEVDRIACEKQQALAAQKEKLQLVQSQLSNYLKVVSQVLRKGSNRQLLTMRRAVEQRVAEIAAEYSQIQITPVEVANLQFVPDEAMLEMCENFGHVFSSSVDPGKCFAQGEGLEWAVVGETASVTLTVITQDEERCTEQLQHIIVELISQIDCSKVKGKVVQQDGSTVVLNYIPPVKGPHSLHIKINGKSIMGSPFTPLVRPHLNFRGSFVKSVSGVSRPWGVAVTSEGKIVVVDNNGWNGLHIFDQDSSLLNSFVRSTNWFVSIPPKDECYEPRGVALDQNGNIFLVDGRNHRIQKFKPDGTFLYTKGSYGKDEPLHFNDPVGIAVNTLGEVYVCDRRNHRIQVLSASLMFLREFGRYGDGPEEFHFPLDVDFDSAGHIYIADCGNFCIKELTPEGRFVRRIGCEGFGQGEFKHVSSICIDRDDFIYAADRVKNCITIFDPSGNFVMQFGTHGEEDGKFVEPLGIAVSLHGHVYVSDSYNGRVQVFR